jgi:hypothetical protein
MGRRFVASWLMMRAFQNWMWLSVVVRLFKHCGVSFAAAVLVFWSRPSATLYAFADGGCSLMMWGMWNGILGDF